MIVKMILKGKSRGQGVVTVSPSASISEAATSLATNKIGALVVVGDDGAIVGMLSERDIVRGVSLQGEVCLKHLVRDLMTASVLTCHEEDTLDSLAQTMTEKRIRHLPVVGGDNKLVGMVTIGDVVKTRLEEASMEVDNLRHYVVAAR